VFSIYFFDPCVNCKKKEIVKEKLNTNCFCNKKIKNTNCFFFQVYKLNSYIIGIWDRAFEIWKLWNYPSQNHFSIEQFLILHATMGVKNLWDILESCKKTVPLHHLQLTLSHSTHNFHFHISPPKFVFSCWIEYPFGWIEMGLCWILSCRNKRVCVDLSCWMVQLQNVSKSHACLKEKVHLRGLFHRLRALIALNCTVVFVSGLLHCFSLFHYFCEICDENRTWKLCTCLNFWSVWDAFSFKLNFTLSLKLYSNIKTRTPDTLKHWCRHDIWYWYTLTLI